MAKILGVSCSLRNARFGSGSDSLIDEIKALDDQDALQAYLENQTRIRAADFIEAGREEGLPFDKIYRNLKKAKGDQGLSNSEAALVASLWGAHREDCEIAHVGLSPFFPMNGPAVDLDELRKIVLDSDGLIISGPVYFGDRGSLAQSFLEFLRDDPECAEHVRGKIYGGIAVGAKRNGGQETTLIYQLVDITNLNMLAVGNDSSTTSQYGGTVVAGDVGTMPDDPYGMKTSIGTGMRVARVVQVMEAGATGDLVDKTKISVWLLQDSAGHEGRSYIEKLCADVEKANPDVSFEVMDFTQEEIFRCIACDVCPVDTGPPEEYRCIIKNGGDLFARMHEQLVDCDAILVAAYSPEDRRDLKSVYQRFVERTRYLRRDDYVIGERLVAPLVISELNARQNLHIRMMTSFIRHNSVMHHSLIGMEMEGRIINWQRLLEQTTKFAETARQVTVGRIMRSGDASIDTHYNPVGYVISAEKRSVDAEKGKVEDSDEIRRANRDQEVRRRLVRG
tara:strand:- start:96334 stop:97854 length:1521 start_codon:yes stop_codon:yes gene_type:complete